MSDTIAVTGGTLVDVRSGTQRPNTTILIEGERIVSIGADAPADARVIDASGAWLLPGLIDMHAHVTGEQTALKAKILHLYLANGVTTVRDTGGNLTQLRLLRDAIAAGQKLGPRVFFAGPILDGLPPVWPSMTILVDTPERGHSAVEFLAEQGVDFVKVYNWVPEASLRTIVETAHAHGLRVTGHVPRTITMTRAIQLEVDCLEHIRITGRELLPLELAEVLDPLPVAQRETALWQHFALESEPMQQLIRLLADSRKQVLIERLKPPSVDYPFGTDRFGRDLLSRSIWAARVSLGVSLAAMLISVSIGALLGMASGFFGGWVDSVVMRFTDLFIAFPVFILLITLVAIYGSSLVLVTVFLGLAAWPATARIVRAEVLSLRAREFILAARVVGANATRIILLHMLPNVLPLIAVAATLQVAQVILIEASLSYFGLGVPPPAATWGNMVSDGRAVLDTAWWVTTFPGLLIVLTVLAYNLMGDGLRDVADPRRQGSRLRNS